MSQLTGSSFKAKIKFYQCKSSYNCIAVCSEQAMTKGAERFPPMACLSDDLLPGKVKLMRISAQVVAIVYQCARVMQSKW